MEYLVDVQTNDNIGKKSNEWSHTLFVEYPHLFLPILENQEQKGQREAIALGNIFDEFDVPPGAKWLVFLWDRYTFYKPS
jgi:hypothetical protein